MNTRLHHIGPNWLDPGLIAEAASVLGSGGLVVLPTETVYGVAADASSAAAVEALRNAKGRPEGKPLPVMIASAEDIATYAVSVPNVAGDLARAFWPGPLTLVLRAAPLIQPGVHAGLGTVGLRNPDHAVALAVLRAAGRPLALTSANISGQAPAASGEDAYTTLRGRVDMVLDAGACPLGVPSTVVDLSTCPPRLLRLGGVPADALRRWLPDLV